MKRQDHPAAMSGKPSFQWKATTAIRQGDIISDRRGFTLIEILMVLAVLAVLVTLAIPSYNDFVNNAKSSRAREEIRTIEKAITTWTLDRAIGLYPPDLAAVGQGGTLDPWGHPYVYRPASGGPGVQRIGHYGIELNTDYDLYSLGPDAITDEATGSVLTAPSQDDILRAGNGGDVALGVSF